MSTTVNVKSLARIVDVELAIVALVPNCSSTGKVPTLPSVAKSVVCNAYLTVPNVEVNGTNFWAKWKLDLNGYNWDFINYGLVSSAIGTRTASGKYIYNAEKGLLIYKFDQSDFYSCGPTVGTGVWFVSPITETSMTWTDPAPRETDLPFELSRSSGVSGDPTGTWNFSSGPNNYSTYVNSDGTITVIGDIVECQ